jgi:hypothetical protein
MTFTERFYDFLIFDKRKQVKILKIIQYTVIYIILIGFFGNLIDKLFPAFDNTKKIIYIYLEIAMQLILSTILIFFIRDFIYTLPLLISPYSTNVTSSVSYQGDIVITLILLNVQINLAKKILFIAERSTKEVVITTGKVADTSTNIVKDVAISSKNIVDTVI